MRARACRCYNIPATVVPRRSRTDDLARTHARGGRSRRRRSGQQGVLGVAEKCARCGPQSLSLCSSLRHEPAWYRLREDASGRDTAAMQIISALLAIAAVIGLILTRP